MADQAKNDDKDKGNDKNDITVTVTTAMTTEAKKFTWPKTKRVGEAATEAASAFGLDATSPTFMKAKEVLDRNKPLVAAGVRDGDELELVAAGGGV